VVIFYSEYYMLKNIRTRKTIGYDIKQGKLYYLDLTSNSFDMLPQALIMDCSKGKKKKTKIRLWH
jgi:hypothetical protein